MGYLYLSQPQFLQPIHDWQRVLGVCSGDNVPGIAGPERNVQNSWKDVAGPALEDGYSNARHLDNQGHRVPHGGKGVVLHDAVGACGVLQSSREAQGNFVPLIATHCTMGSLGGRMGSLNVWPTINKFWKRFRLIVYNWQAPTLMNCP